MIVWVKLSQFHRVTQAARGRKECPVVLGQAHFTLNTAAVNLKSKRKHTWGEALQAHEHDPYQTRVMERRDTPAKEEEGTGGRSRDTGETKDRLPQFLTWLEKVSAVAWMGAGVCVRRLPP